MTNPLLLRFVVFAYLLSIYYYSYSTVIYWSKYCGLLVLINHRLKALLQLLIAGSRLNICAPMSGQQG